MRRIWAYDGSLWSDDPTRAAAAAERLGWLRLPESMRGELDAVRDFAGRARADGVRDVVLCGMGGSSLAPEVLAAVFGAAPGCPRLHVLDTTDPREIRAVERKLELRSTLFLIASKSGSTIETDALCRHFTQRLEAAGLRPGAHLVAITDAGSELERLARDGDWRACFLNPADVGGRYSALSLFGLVPAALLGIDVARLLESGAREAAACSPGAADSVCAALELGAAMGALAQRGIDKLTLRASPTLASFGDWVEQLVAESTGKAGPDGPVGVLPVVGEDVTVAPGPDRFVVTLQLGDESLSADASDAVPSARFRVSDGYGLGGLFFRFEFATALAGALLGIDPFDQPDVAAAKAATSAVLSGGLPRAAAVHDADALRSALASAPEGGYVALLSYLPRSPTADAAVRSLASAIGRTTGLAVTVGVGPRYLHSTGQLHKGGPASGVFVVLEGDDVAGTSCDLPIPGRPYSFGRLFRAQCEGDVQTLTTRGRTVVRLRATADATRALGEWEAALLGA